MNAKFSKNEIVSVEIDGAQRLARVASIIPRPRIGLVSYVVVFTDDIRQQGHGVAEADLSAIGVYYDEMRPGAFTERPCRVVSTVDDVAFIEFTDREGGTKVVNAYELADANA